MVRKDSCGDLHTTRQLEKAPLKPYSNKTKPVPFSCSLSCTVSMNQLISLALAGPAVKIFFLFQPVIFSL